ncbi:hypothetical protein GCM10028862_02660 [Luteimonas pelagia]
MKWTREQLDQRLRGLEAQVPNLLEDRDGFFRAFEDEVEIILGRTRPEDQAYAEEALEAIVERSGING